VHIVVPIEGESKAAACLKGHAVRLASPCGKGHLRTAGLLGGGGLQASRLLDSHISSILCDCAYVGGSGLQTQG